MTAKRCPSCGLFNPSSATRCDCGASLVTASAPETRPVPLLHRIIVGAAALALIFAGLGAFLQFVSRPGDEKPRTPEPTGTRAADLPRPQPHEEPLQSGITLDKYLQLKTGMTYQQAVTILGQDGVEQSRSDLAGYVTVMFTWQGPGLGNMNAMFQNGRLIQKAQFGLR